MPPQVLLELWPYLWLLLVVELLVKLVVWRRVLKVAKLVPRLALVEVPAGVQLPLVVLLLLLTMMGLVLMGMVLALTK